MERRFLAWLMISIALALIYFRFIERPGQQPKKAADQGLAANADKGGKAPLEGAPPEPPPNAPEAPAAAPPMPLPKARDIPAEYRAIGSVQRDGPYRLLLTATNKGAAILRAELADPHYSDLHDAAGYLGHLEAVDAEGGGAEVRVVGAGTPAAQAGLQKGDVIKAVGGVPVDSAAELETALAQTEPGDRIGIQAERDGQERKFEGVKLIRRPLEVMRPERENLEARERNATGYLGKLEPKDAEGGGAEVRVVGPGTPAAQAGLQKGDVIKAVGGVPVNGADQLESVLARTEPGERIRIEFERNGQPRTIEDVELIRRPPEPFDDAPSFRLTLEQIGDQQLGDDQRELPNVDLLNGNWEVVTAEANAQQSLFVPQGPDEVVFRKVIPDAFLEVYKRYRVARVSEGPDAAPAYHFELDIGLRNVGPQPQKVAYRLDGPTGLPTEGWWYLRRIGREWFQNLGLRAVTVRFEGNQGTKQYGAPDVAKSEDEGNDEEELLTGGKPLVYAGVDSLYFAALMIPEKERLREQWFADVEAVLLEPKLKSDKSRALSNVTCRLIREEITLEPGDAHTDSFKVFCGPKQPELLAQYYPPGRPDYSLDDVLYYGWFWWVARPMLAMLEFFYGIVGNYGIAIIMLTVLVRACMMPLSLKQAKNMAKMQELQPEMQRIAEKYKGDMEKRARAQQELFRKHNYNPMGGCLMAFVQFPIFIGLYRGLMLDVELRQAPLFSESIRWCSNLGAPDMFLDWSGWMPSFVQGFLGPYLNVLPIVTVFLFLLQQKMFMPPPTTEQAAMQQKIMKFMMIVIGFFFYKVASALCLYFIASSVWGIVERKLIPRPMPQTAGAVAGGEATSGAKRDRPADRPRPGRNGQPRSKAKAKSRRKR